MTHLLALALVLDLAAGAVGKGSTVKITTRSGKVVLGVVVDEMPTGFGIQNGNQREIVSYGDIAEITELGVQEEAPPPPPPMPPPVAPPDPTATAPLAPMPPVVVEPEPPPPPPPPDPPSSIAIRTNLLDPVFFGPTLGVEVELVSKLGVMVEGRALNGGLMNALHGPYGPSNFGNVVGSYQLRFDVGGGGTLGAAYFVSSRKGLRGIFLIAAAEVLYRTSRLERAYNYSGSSGPAWKAGTIAQWFVTPHARIGWRWRAGPVLLGLGVRGGAGVLVAASGTFGGATTPWGSDQKVFLDLSAIFELGFFLR